MRCEFETPAISLCELGRKHALAKGTLMHGKLQHGWQKQPGLEPPRPAIGERRMKVRLRQEDTVVARSLGRTLRAGVARSPTRGS